MSLLQEAMESCKIMDKRTVPDGYGGYEEIYSEGAEISAAFPLMSADEQMVALSKGTNAKYKITTVKALNLQYHDVLKRERDGKIFRVTSDGDDNKTPASAMLDMRQVEAEEWSIPS